MEWVEVNGTVLRVTVEGEGPPLVLVHEIGGMIESYDDIVPLLKESRKVVRFDIRGSGLSEFAVQPLTFQVLIADLLGLLDHLKLRRFLLPDVRWARLLRLRLPSNTLSA